MAGYHWLIDDRRSQQVMPRTIPKKMKSVIDSDLATICEDRNLTTTQLRLREKLKRKQSSEALEQHVSKGDADGTRPKQKASKGNNNRTKNKTTLNDRDNVSPATIEGTACNVARTDKLNNYRSGSDVSSHKLTPMDGAHGDDKVNQTTTNMSSYSEKKVIARLRAKYLENSRRDLGKRPGIVVRVSESNGKIAERKLEVGSLRLETSMSSTEMSQTLQESIASTPQGFKCKMPCYKHSSERDLRIQRRNTSSVRSGHSFVNRIFDGILRHIGQRNGLLQPATRPSATFSDIAIRALWSNKREKDAFVCYIIRLFDLYTNYCLPPESFEQTSTTPSNSRDSAIFGIEIQIFRMLALSYLAQLTRDLTKSKPPHVKNNSLPISPKRKLSFLDAEVGWPVSRLNNEFMIPSEGKNLLIAGRSCRECFESFTTGTLHQTLGRNVLCSEIMYNIRKMLAANQNLPNSVMSVELVIRENDGNYLTSRRNDEESEENISDEDDQPEIQSQGSELCDDSDHQENYGIRLCLYLE